MVKAYILKNIVRNDGELRLYIPKSEKGGPAGLKLDDDYSPLRIGGEDKASELAVTNGRSAGYVTIRKIIVPQEINDLIISYRAYLKKDLKAKSILNKILTSNK